MKTITPVIFPSLHKGEVCASMQRTRPSVQSVRTSNCFSSAQCAGYRGRSFRSRVSGENYVELLPQQNRLGKSGINFSALIHPGKPPLSIEGINFVRSKVGQTGQKGTLLTGFLFHASELCNVTGNYDAARSVCFLTLFCRNDPNQQGPL